MIYHFSHYPLRVGSRRVRFVAAREELQRAARVLGTSWIAGRIRGAFVAELKTSTRDVTLDMTPGEARHLADVWRGCGGDCAVSARMLEDALTGMVEEIRADRDGPGRQLALADLGV